MDENRQHPSWVGDVRPADVPALLIIYPPVEPVAGVSGLSKHPADSKLGLGVLAGVRDHHVVDGR